MTKDKSIFIKNVYYMLAYAFGTLNQKEYEDVAKEDFENIHNLFASILSKGIGRQLKQGLYREYVNHKEDLSVVRGKINMQGTVKHRLARRQMLCCEYDELSEDNLLNRILKTASMLLLRHGNVEGEYRTDLKKKMLFFSNVEEIDPYSIRWSSIRYQRNNQSYRMMIGICQLLIEGMLQTTEEGSYKLASFVDDKWMHVLYERFILAYYAKEHPELHVAAPQIKWALDDDMETLLPKMQSDTLLTDKKTSTVLIIDAKYYTRIMQTHHDVDSIRSQHLYQIFTYVKNKDAEYGNRPHTVSGMLLYAATDEALQPDHTYQMSGNRISVKTLDLNREFKEIAAQLDRIAEDHFGQVLADVS